MGLVYSSVVDALRDEVFAWHARPGAFLRLSPPWQPMGVITEADSLQNGRAELALPGGLRWVAEPQADGYDPPRRFVDTIGAAGLASLPARIAMRWRHIHEFEDAGDKPVTDSAIPTSTRPCVTYSAAQKHSGALDPAVLRAV